jgi:hypothetical protein
VNVPLTRDERVNSTPELTSITFDVFAVIEELAMPIPPPVRVVILNVFPLGLPETMYVSVVFRPDPAGRLVNLIFSPMATPVELPKSL